MGDEETKKTVSDSNPSAEGEGFGHDEVIQLKDQFYVLATSSLTDQRTRVLKDGEAFAAFDINGNIQPIGLGVQGIYDGATRYLSYFELKLHRMRPLLLSSNVRSDNSLLTVDMMNRDAPGNHAGQPLPGTVHLFRSKFFWDRVCYERLRVTNYGTDAVDIALSFIFKADFADIFELRGSRRLRRGEMLPPQFTDESVEFSYAGLDHVVRRTKLRFLPAPHKLSGSEAQYKVSLAPLEKMVVYAAVSCAMGEAKPEVLSYRKAYARMVRSTSAGAQDACRITTSNTQFNGWLERSKADLHMMITQTPFGPYPYAGVPLFNTVFGRDGLITALQALWIEPHIAKGVLAYLADTQATEVNAEQDAEPGKILHEVRTGEMVALGEVPFRRYYGSVDSTPLFLILAGEYFQRTGDRAFIDSIWGPIEKALNWLDEYGDADGDGFVEYFRKSPRGLRNQGWKDAHDSVFHADGTLAEGPIALCEIQGYAFSARLRVADLFQARGDQARAAKLRAQAEAQRENFEKNFWCEDLSTYALALDGEKKACRVRTSNAGHALFSGIALPDRALRVAFSLMGSTMFSGWGVRTVAATESRFNPMSYHNGSIWPHDNSMIAEGMSKYGFKELTKRLLSAQFAAALSMDQLRLPELFCGFLRRSGEGPTLYPVACSPQSWASASVFLLLKAVLGMTVRAEPAQVRFSYPELPESVDSLRIENLKVSAEASVDLLVERYNHSVGVTILKKRGDVEVIVVQ